MARLYLFAEGQTEQTFASDLLIPHLARFGVYLHGPVLIANHRERGHVFRGGGRHYLPMKNDIVRFLKQERGSDVYFTTMIDLYGIFHDFPGRQEAERLRDFPVRRVKSLQDAFVADIGDPRFIPYIQLHEYEAYLFADIRKFEAVIDGIGQQVARLEAIAASYTSPELINDGEQSAPSKRIQAEIPEYAQSKRVIGPLVTESIGLEAIRARCPHFNDWLTRLEQLGTPIV